MRTAQRIILFIFLITAIWACQNKNTSKESSNEKDVSYKKYIDHQLKVLGRPAGYYKNLEIKYTYNLDTISKDSFHSIDFDSVYHIFQDVNFDFVSKDSITRKVTLNTITKNYYKSHTFKPSFLEVSYYSDNLLSLSLGSKEHGNMKCGMYDKETGVKLSGFNKDNYEGSFFLGSMTKHDTFKEVRMILKIDTLFYEQSYLTKDIDDRVNIQELEK